MPRGPKPSASALARVVTSDSKVTTMPTANHDQLSERFERLRRIGSLSWSALGIVGLVVVAALALGAISGVVIPLVVAVIFGIVLEPLCRSLQNRGVKPTLATAITLLVFLLGSLAGGWLIVRGLLQQIPEIARQLEQGWSALLKWMREHDYDTILLARVREALSDNAPHLSRGLLEVAASSFSSVIALVISTFFALFFLFFALRDSRLFPLWLAKVTHQDPVLVDEVAELSKSSLRNYFKGVAITALITAPIFMIPIVILRIPLAIPLFVLYFVLSFVPYVGAWLTGAIAVLIAFGSGGATAALIILLSLIISNGAIQNAVASWAIGSSLHMHPAVVLIATLVGGTVAGILGMILTPPVVAAAIAGLQAVRTHVAESQPPLDISPST